MLRSEMCISWCYEVHFEGRKKTFKMYKVLKGKSTQKSKFIWENHVGAFYPLKKSCSYVIGPIWEKHVEILEVYQQYL